MQAKAQPTYRWRWRAETADLTRLPDALLREWEALADRFHLPLTASPQWMCCFARAFVPPGQAILHALYLGSTLVAAVPVLHFPGWPATIGSLENAHSPSFTFALDASLPYVGEWILETLLERADRLILRRLHAGSGACNALIASAASLGLAYSFLPMGGDVTVDVRGSWETILERWSSGMAKEARRCLQRAEKAGDVTVERWSGSPALPEILEACFALEASTWKGRAGTAILDDPAVTRFYRELAERMHARDAFSLYLLRKGGRLIAFDYGLRGRGRLDSLKIAYDEEHGKLAPGNLLTLHLLRNESTARRIQSVHLGRPTPAKQRWATQVSELSSLRIYASSAGGHAAYLLGPGLRERLEQLPWIATAVTGARTLVAKAGPLLERLERTRQKLRR